jgi:cellulose biosynthesis protein BcsQ
VIGALADDYDYVILDCPPAISLASESVFAAADVLLVPLIPTPLSVRTFEQLQRFVADDVPKPRPRILAFFSMVDGRKTLHRAIVDELHALADGRVLDAGIPAATDVEKMALTRRALAGFAPNGRAARAYEALWEELRPRL